MQFPTWLCVTETRCCDAVPYLAVCNRNSCCCDVVPYLVVCNRNSCCCNVVPYLVVCNRNSCCCDAVPYLVVCNRNSCCCVVVPYLVVSNRNFCCCVVVPGRTDTVSGTCSRCLLSCLSGKASWIPRVYCSALCSTMWTKWRSRDNSSEHLLVSN